MYVCMFIKYVMLQCGAMMKKSAANIGNSFVIMAGISKSSRPLNSSLQSNAWNTKLILAWHYHLGVIFYSVQLSEKILAQLFSYNTTIEKRKTTENRIDR